MLKTIISGQVGIMLRSSIGVLTILLLSGCSYAPSISFLGAFFPAWLLCISIGIICTLLARLILFKTQYIDVIGYLPLIYTALTALFSFLCWLLFFQPQ